MAPQGTHRTGPWGLLTQVPRVFPSAAFEEDGPAGEGALEPEAAASDDVAVDGMAASAEKPRERDPRASARRGTCID